MTGLLLFQFASPSCSNSRPGQRSTRSSRSRRTGAPAASNRCSAASTKLKSRLQKNVLLESWHLLHLYAYLGVGLALPHQLWTGQDFLASTARTVFWWGLWIAAAGVGAGLAGRAAAVAQRPVRHPGHRGRARGRRRRLGVHGRPAAGPAATPRPASSSPSASSAARAGPAPTPTRCRPRPTAATCGSPSRSSATAAPRCGRCAPAPGCWSRARTAGSAPGPAPGAKVALIGAGVGITPLRALAEGLDYAPGRRRPAVPLLRPAAVRAGAVGARRRARPGGHLAARPPARPRLLARRRRRRRRAT